MRISLYRTLSLRYLQQRWSRAAMVVASIALGVATLVATRALNQSMTAAAQVASRPMAGIADLHVTNGEAGVRQDLTAELADIPGVRAIMPLLIENVILPDLGNRRAVLVGVELSISNLQDNPWKIEYRVTDPFRAWQLGRQSVFAGKELADDLTKSLAAGSKTFRILAAGEPRQLPLWVGTVEAKDYAAALGGYVLYMDASAAGKLLGRPGIVSRLDLTLEPNADRDKVLARVEQVLGNKARVQTPEAYDQKVHDAMDGLQIGFSICGAGALVVGLFLVYNVLSVSVTERRHEIGILRSLGATRGQICILFVGEALFLGVLGCLVGMPVGWVLAHLGLTPMQTVFSDLFLSLQASSVVVTVRMLMIASAAGVTTALLAAWLPALKASNEAPANAVRRNPPPATISHFVMQFAFSVLLIAAGASCLVLRESLPRRWGTHGCLVLMVLGLLLLTPFWAAMLAHLLRPLARHVLGFETRLAADNLVRAPGRTGLVITALAAGVAMMLQTAGVIRSNMDVILQWIDDSIVADLFVTSGSPVSGSGQNMPLKDSVARDIERSHADISAALPVRFRKLDFREREVFLVALDGKDFYREGQSRGDIPGLDLYPRMADPGPPGVIVSDNFSALYGVKKGDTFTVRAPSGPVDLKVIGAIPDYSWNLGTVMMDRGRYQEHFQDPLVDVFDVFLKPGADEEAVRETILRRWGVEYALVVLKRNELRDRIEGIIRRLYDVAYAQVIVVGIVAALGVMTALLIAVMQRRSELGVLRALGATQVQVLLSVLAEAALMGLIGVAIGLAVGVPIEWYILQIILFEESGFRFAVSIPWTEAGVIATAALLTATLAGLVPALHTLRLRIPEAIAYE